MTVRFYLMPAVIDVVNGRLTKHPKYDTLYRPTGAMDYGREGHFLVAADVSPAEHAAISGNADVASFPANLDNEIGAALATVTAEAESRNIPLAGIDATSTYRQLLRRVVLCCQLGQRLEGERFRLFPASVRQALFGGGITLDSAFNQLGANERTILIAVFDSFGFDRSALTAASTLRVILASFRAQWRGGDIDVGGEPL